MTVVFILARPRGYSEGSPIIDYVIEDRDNNVLATASTLPEAVHWTKERGYSPLVARIREFYDKSQPDQWREA